MLAQDLDYEEIENFTNRIYYTKKKEAPLIYDTITMNYKKENIDYFIL